MKNPKEKKPATTLRKTDRLTAVRPSGAKDKSVSVNDQIYEIVRQIPAGRVTTYGTIAKILHLPNPRMVGHAMNSIETKDAVPAHRVVNSVGKLSGGHTEGRRKKLIKEGVELKGDKIIGFREIFWDPSREEWIL